MFCAFRLYGDFIWPPAKADEKPLPTLRKQGSVEVNYARPDVPKGKWRAFVTWRPAGSSISDAPPPALEDIYALADPHLWLAEHGDKPVSVWIDGNGAEVGGEQVAFRGAFLFEQYEPGSDKPTLHWPLVRQSAYHVGDDQVLSELIIGQPDDNDSYRFNLQLPTPFPQTTLGQSGTRLLAWPSPHKGPASDILLGPSMISNALSNYDLTGRNTLGLKAQSRYAVLVEDEGQLSGLFDMAEQALLPVRVLGGGSNVILGEHYAGITAIMASHGRALTPASGGRVIVEALAGENWHDLVAWTVQQGLWGLENLAGIPGTVGAAPIQNIGAYGVEVSDRFHSLVAFDRTTRSMVTLDRNACRFAYRHSVFKEQQGRYVVTRIRLELTENGRPELGYRELSNLGPVDHPEQVMNAVLKLRTAKLPDWRILGNVGSFFHNPVLAEAEARAFVAQNPNAPAYPQPDRSVKLSAGWLIERAGLKGYRRGPVGVSDQHALVLVNHGGATRTELMALADHVVAVVMERFGITLNREPQLI